MKFNEVKKTTFLVFCFAILFTACNIVKHLEHENEDEEENEMEHIGEMFEQEFDKTKDPNTGTVPRERLLQAAERQNQIFASAATLTRAVPGIAWQERGPNNVAGRIRAILIDKKDTTNKKVWVGGIGGGLWYTLDITTTTPTWVKINDFWNNIGVSAIAQDATTPNNIYVGTGEGFGNGGAQRGLGIWKSTDGGNTWNQLSSTTNFGHVQDMAFDKNGKLYAATNSSTSTLSGLMRSDDGGATWVQVLSTITTVAASSKNCSSIQISANGDVYAAMGVSGDNGGIYKSTAGTTAGDAGTWTNITPSTTGVISAPNNFWQRIRLAAAPSNNNFLYAVFQGNGSNDCTSIQLYDAGTNTWAVKTVPKIIDQNSSAASYPAFTRGQCWYDLVATVDPNNANTLVVGGVDQCKTTDGGTTWNQTSVWTLGANEQAAGFTNSQMVHADHHNLVYIGTSSANAIISCDGGIYTTNNMNVPTNKPTFTSKNIGLNITQLYACAFHPTNANYFLDGTQDNGSHKYTASGINNTTVVSGGDGGFCHISQTNTNNQITAYTNNNYYVSTNGGESFASATAVNNNRGSFINPTDYDGNNLYGGDDAGCFFRWTNPQGNAATGSKITVTEFGTAKVTHVTISKQTNNRVYFGLNNGSIVKVDNANTSNTGTTLFTPRSGASVSSVAFTATNEDSMLVCYSNYGGSKIYVSGNANQASPTITDITGNLPDMPVRWIIFDPRSHKMAIAATEVGVWSCDDITAATPDWTTTNTGLANTRVDMLKYRSGDRTLIAATHGRGLFTATIPANLNPEVNFNVASITTNELNSKIANTCQAYTDYNAFIIINGAPVGADAVVTLNLNSGGTAVEGKDFDFSTNGIFGVGSSKTITIPQNTTNSFPVTIRVYDDAITESNETATLSFTTTGGGSSVGNSNPTIAINITDNDVNVQAPTTSANPQIGPNTDGTAVAGPTMKDRLGLRDIYFTAAELTAAGLVNGSNITAASFNITTKNTTTAFNNFTVSMGHVAATPTTTSGFLASTGYTQCWTGTFTSVAGNNTITFNNNFVWNGVSNVVIRFCYTNSADDPGDNDEYATHTAPNGTSSLRWAPYVNNTVNTTATNGCTMATATFYPYTQRPVINFTHYKPGTLIETLQNTQQINNVTTQTATYNFYSANGKAIASINNPNADLGCVTAAIVDSGVAINTVFANGTRSKKVWSISPTTNATTTQHTVTFYMTTAELASTNPSTLKIYKTTATNASGATTANTVTAVTTVSQNAEFTSFTATFTGFGVFFIGTNNITLPLNWLSINAQLNAQKQVVVTWKVKENGVLKYDVEKSIDGRNFITIGQNNSKGNGENSYAFTDVNSTNDVTYYRIKQIDIDGKSSYSTVVQIGAVFSNTIQAYPSPFTDGFFVSCKKATNAMLLANNGTILKKLHLQAGKTYIPASTLSKGVYLLKSDDGQVIRLVKE